MLLIRNAELYAPGRVGLRDILVAGETIVMIAGRIDCSGLPEAPEILDACGRAVVPGFVDGHVHVTGGGGEGGFATRTPELLAGDAVAAGVTTVVGVLGTDGVCRSPEALVAKVYGLRAEGISAWCFTGSYRVPPVTLTGAILKDIMLVDPVIGVGEIAVSDHRSSRPSDQEIARVVADARVGGMLSGKAGVVNVHLGDAPDALGPLERICAPGDLPRTQFLPTHCNRNPRLLERALDWAEAGGLVDFTAGAADLSGTADMPGTADLSGAADMPGAADLSGAAGTEAGAAAAVAAARSRGIPPTRVTVSSDGQGSLPRFDGSGRLAGYAIGTCASLLDYLRSATTRFGVPLAEALVPITASPATILGLPRKGRAEVGMDADLVILDEGLRPDTVIARGRIVMRGGRTRMGGMSGPSPGSAP